MTSPTKPLIRVWEIRSEEMECQVYGPSTDGQPVKVIALSDVKPFFDRMKQLGQAMPPNAVSMEIQKALKNFEGVFE